MRVFIPCDAAALAVGADKIALAIAKEALARDVDLKLSGRFAGHVLAGTAGGS